MHLTGPWPRVDDPAMDYPQNLREFDRLFAHKDACLRFLEEVRWGGQFQCQRCGARAYWALSSGLRRCQSCRFKNSVKAGTIFESSRLPLKMWFYAIWWIAAQKTGVSALDLQRDVGLGSYRSAWLLLHKIRSAMASADRALLAGEVELSEIRLGAGGAEQVIVAAEVSGPKRTGRIRIEKCAPSAGLGAFLLANVAKGATVYTDGTRGFGEIGRMGYRHSPRQPTKTAQVLPHVHLVCDQMQRWLKGTLHGRVEAKHLDSYLEEFCFRFNWRSSKARGQLFQRVMESAVRVAPFSYRNVVERKSKAH